MPVEEPDFSQGMTEEECFEKKLGILWDIEEEGKGEIGRATKATIIINHIQEGSSSLVPEERIQRQAILSGCISWF